VKMNWQILLKRCIHICKVANSNSHTNNNININDWNNSYETHQFNL